MMQLPQYVIRDTPPIPSIRSIRKARRRLLSRGNPSVLRWILVVTVIVIIGFYISHRESDGAVDQDLRISRIGSNGLAKCFHSSIGTLGSFDPFVSSTKSRGLAENDFENRFQEDVWDTAISTRSFFPAWSDMRWNLPQYARYLGHDLALVQAIAAHSIHLAPKRLSANLTPFQSSKASVHVNYAHHRLDRLRGLQYLVNFTPRRKQLNFTTYNLLVERSLDQAPCRVSLGSSDPSEAVYILLPYKKRTERLRLFLQNFFYLRAEQGENLVLVISILRDSVEDRRDVDLLKTETFGSTYRRHSNSVLLHENDGDVAGSFSRGVALREAAKLVPSANSVIFHCDVDMLILPTFFDRCRHSTILGSQVYYPVFYSLYPYANNEPAIAERNGFWRKTSFGMTCIRKGDFEAVGAYDDAETRFHGWGSEDVYQFEHIRNTSNLVAFRAVEPFLMHRWHSKQCDRSSEAYIDCMKTNFATMGHPLRVGPALLDSLRNVDDFLAKLQNV